MDKQLVTTKKGAQVRMNEVALKMAERHFGLNRHDSSIREVPIELLKMPKVDITRAVKLEPVRVTEVSVLKEEPEKMTVEEFRVKHDKEAKERFNEDTKDLVDTIKSEATAEKSVKKPVIHRKK